MFQSKKTAFWRRLAMNDGRNRKQQEVECGKTCSRHSVHTETLLSADELLIFNWSGSLSGRCACQATRFSNNESKRKKAIFDKDTSFYHLNFNRSVNREVSYFPKANGKILHWNPDVLFVAALFIHNIVLKWFKGPEVWPSVMSKNMTDTFCR